MLEAGSDFFISSFNFSDINNLDLWPASDFRSADPSLILDECPTHFLQQAWRPQVSKGAKMIPKKRKVSQVRDWRVRIEADQSVPIL